MWSNLNINFCIQKGEIVCDMTIGTHWNFEVNWCPRNPFLVSTSSFDSRASIYSLSGGKPAAPTSNKVLRKNFCKKDVLFSMKQ